MKRAWGPQVPILEFQISNLYHSHLIYKFFLIDWEPIAAVHGILSPFQTKHKENRKDSGKLVFHTCSWEQSWIKGWLTREQDNINNIMKKPFYMLLYICTNVHIRELLSLYMCVQLKYQFERFQNYFSFVNAQLNYSQQSSNPNAGPACMKKPFFHDFHGHFGFHGHLLFPRPCWISTAKCSNDIRAFFLYTNSSPGSK